MQTNKILRLTFFISLLTHGAAILHASSLNPFCPAPKKQDLEVRYIPQNRQIKLPSKAYSNKPALPGLTSKTEPFLKLDSQITAENKNIPAYANLNNPLELEKLLPKKTAGIPKPVFTSSPMVAIKKKISLPPIEMAKINNPNYINYYQIVREKIRRCAYQNYTHNETGEVYVSFVISNDGNINDARLVEEKTAASSYLKDISLKSIKNASPFPDFPKELDYSQLSFNIIISFEIE